MRAPLQIGLDARDESWTHAIWSPRILRIFGNHRLTRLLTVLLHRFREAQPYLHLTSPRLGVKV